MDLHLKDTTALIAGATQGIGLATAQAFLREGANVVVTGRSQDRLDRTAEFLSQEKSPATIMTFAGDMTQANDIEAVLEQAWGRFGAIDSLVANVGSGVGKRGLDNEQDDWTDSFQHNFFGSVLMAQSVLKRMQKRQSGNVTFIGSIAGIEAINAPLPYSAAKAALHGAMKGLAVQAGPFGVRVNAIAPGNILFEGGSWAEKLKHQREKFEGYIAQEVSLQRFGTPQEIADLVVFISSPRGAFITGSVIVADGGQTRSWQ